MNIDNRVNWLFLDLNSFFASCEQDNRPELRGRPVAVVQMDTDSTCAIAASYEAKAYGIKTGTPVWEAKALCRDLILVKARHKLYGEYHRRVLKAIDTCLPVEKTCSIDEMACRLTGPQREVPAAQELARKVKQAIRALAGEKLSCSIGLAPSLFLGKVASDMQKPDGLVTITRADLPHVLYRLKLTDIYGIGRRMEHRLNYAGIATVEDLLRAPRAVLRRAWGGVTGVLYHELLHGADLQFPAAKESRSMSHQHVLEPSLRTLEGAQQFSQHLLAKAAERMRDKNYYARRLGLFLTWTQDGGRWWDEIAFHETQDSHLLARRLMQLWPRVPPYKPKKVGVVLLDLVPAARHQPDLFTEGSRQAVRRRALSPLIDRINRKYGRNAIALGLHDEQVQRFTGHAAFNRVPEQWEF